MNKSKILRGGAQFPTGGDDVSVNRFCDEQGGLVRDPDAERSAEGGPGAIPGPTV
ncbi:UNVERIFIED_CONTAM: hypothetical protein ABIC26_002366 [Paenibacillus sp. PvR008]